jgi:hypothetical protein
MSTEIDARGPGGFSASWISRRSWDYRSIVLTGQPSEPSSHMRRFVVLGLVGALAFSFVGFPASRAATIASSWPVGKAPFGLALDPATGKVYVANSQTAMLDGTGRISVVDPATSSVVSLTTSLSASFVVADASGRRLYSSNASLFGLPRPSTWSISTRERRSRVSPASVDSVSPLMRPLAACSRVDMN